MESCWFLSRTSSCCDSGSPEDSLRDTRTSPSVTCQWFYMKSFRFACRSLTCLFLCVCFPAWRSLVSRRQIWNRSLEWCQGRRRRRKTTDENRRSTFQSRQTEGRKSRLKKKNWCHRFSLVSFKDFLFVKAAVMVYSALALINIYSWGIFTLPASISVRTQLLLLLQPSGQLCLNMNYTPTVHWVHFIKDLGVWLTAVRRMNWL